MKTFKSFKKQMEENFFGPPPEFLNIRKNLPRRKLPNRPKTVKARIEKAQLLRSRADKSNSFEPK